MLSYLDIMSQDPAFTTLQPSFALKRACLQTTLAITSLLCGDDPTFHDAISASVRDLPPWSTTQSILYKLRHTPRLAAHLYKAHRTLQLLTHRLRP
jgi:hypothetical protein